VLFSKSEDELVFQHPYQINSGHENRTNSRKHRADVGVVNREVAYIGCIPIG